jgi:hypothetical protein
MIVCDHVVAAAGVGEDTEEEEEVEEEGERIVTVDAPTSGDRGTCERTLNDVMWGAAWMYTFTICRISNAGVVSGWRIGTSMRPPGHKGCLWRNRVKIARVK